MSILKIKSPDGTWSGVPTVQGDKGDPGLTPDIQIGTVETLPSDQKATASITGTPEKPELNLGIPKGKDGAGGGGSTIDDTGEPSPTSTRSSEWLSKEFARPEHKTMIVEAYTEGIGFKSSHKASDIKRHADGGGVVILRFTAPDGTGEQSYPYETFKDGKAIFRRAYAISPDIGRIVITIDENSNVVKTEDFMKYNPETKTEAMTQPVGVDETGKLFTEPGGDISLGMTGATVGQIAKITAVGPDGAPTKWEPVDMPSGGGGEKLVAEETVLASGVILENYSGPRTDTGVTVSVLQGWKTFALHIKNINTGVNASFNVNNDTFRRFYWKNTSQVLVCTWADTEKNILKANCVGRDDGFTKMNAVKIIWEPGVAGFGYTDNQFAPAGVYLNLSGLTDKKLYIETNGAPKVDLSWEIIGVIKYA